MSKKGVSRFSVSIPPSLLDRFDKTIRDIGYEDRSKAIHASMRNFITDYEWMHKTEGAGIGTIVILYDHKARGLENTLTDIQHHYEEIIRSSMHIHIDENNCLEIIAVKGENKRIKTLSQKLTTKKGVKQLKLTIITSKM